MTRFLTFGAVVIAAAAAATSAGAHVDAACTGAQLKGTFNAVRGSAGAGNITYKLVLENASTRRCTLTGLPQGRLLGKTGNALPTHIKPAFAPGLTAILALKKVTSGVPAAISQFAQNVYNLQTGPVTTVAPTAAKPATSAA